MIKSLVAVLMLSGTAAVLPHVAIAQTQESAVQNVPKSDFVAAQKAYNNTKTTKEGAASYDRFNALMRKTINYQKTQLVATNDDPVQVEKFRKMTDLFEKITKANRSDNRVEITNGMTAFINLL